MSTPDPSPALTGWHDEHGIPAPWPERSSGPTKTDASVRYAFQAEPRRESARLGGTEPFGHED